MGTGIFVAIVGPSGAGKDSLIAGARTVLAADPAVRFARRIITREPDATEDSEGCTPEAFRAMAQDGAFALWWEANGQGYGLPHAIINDFGHGRTVVANISRGSIAEARERFGRVHVVHVTASLETLALRLAARARETADERAARLIRALEKDRDLIPDTRIDNDGPLAGSVARLVAVLTALRVPVA
ncbi:MAG: phosphonate metabolism protein/1,5-bisphosphokinase (PRPP-forming) PhnN [Beijerinckiaceae bacterium]